MRPTARPAWRLGPTGRATISIARLPSRGFAQSGFNEVAIIPPPTPVLRDLTEASRFPLVGFSDSRCWLGLGASIDGETLFGRSSGSCGGLDSGRSLVSCDGGDFWGKRGQRGEVVAALAGDRQRGGEADGRLAATAAEERAGVALGADRREAGPDVAGDGSRTGRARHAGELRRGVALLQARRDHVQKKACTPASRIAPTSRGAAPGGSSTRAGLTPGAWCSSTRPGPRPI